MSSSSSVYQIKNWHAAQQQCETAEQYIMIHSKKRGKYCIYNSLTQLNLEKEIELLSLLLCHQFKWACISFLFEHLNNSILRLFLLLIHCVRPYSAQLCTAITCDMQRSVYSVLDFFFHSSQSCTRMSGSLFCCVSDSASQWNLSVYLLKCGWITWVFCYFLNFCFYENNSRTSQNIFSSVLICLLTNNEFPVVPSFAAWYTWCPVCYNWTSTGYGYII